MAEAYANTGIYPGGAGAGTGCDTSPGEQTQVLNVLKLPEDVLANVKAEGDPMPAPVFTERMLRTRG